MHAIAAVRISQRMRMRVRVPESVPEWAVVRVRVRVRGRMCEYACGWQRPHAGGDCYTLGTSTTVFRRTGGLSLQLQVQAECKSK